MKQEAGPIPEWHAWWAVAVLFLAYTLSFIDRSIISLLVEPMRADLGLNDTQISLLQGLAFTLFYTSMSLPIAYVADKRSRPMLIGIGMFVWSAMTALCGLATNFIQLFLARMGVGVGEATLGPAAYSLIADLFPPEKRGQAMAVFSSGISFGAGLAFLLGGLVIGIVNSGALSASFVSGLSSWQLVFILIGVPGMLGALLLVSVPEPRHRRFSKNAQLSATSPPLQPILPFIRSNSLLVSCLFATFAISGLIFTAYISWGPTLLIRQFGLSAPEAGKLLGVGLIIFGPLGAFIGGWLVDRGVARSRAAAPFHVGIIGIALMSVAGIGAALATSTAVAGTLITAALFFGSFAYPAGASLVQSIAPAEIRARFAALYLFAVTLIAATLGPTIVALLTDFLFADPQKLGASIAITLAIMAPAGIYTAIVGARLLILRSA